MAASLFAFVDQQTPLQQALNGHHSPGLVLLSLLIAVLAAFASFNHARLMRSARSLLTRFNWHLSGAVAMGLGVWAMHFTGMMAYALPVRYHIVLTGLSVLPAILAAFAALQVVVNRRPSITLLLLGGVVMGLGIGAMHYLGMAAMVLPA
jgi:NO-binding membrane sensor protein with MHYT domain